MDIDDWEEMMYERYCDTFNEGNDLNDAQIAEFRVWMENNPDLGCDYVYEE